MDIENKIKELITKGRTEDAIQLLLKTFGSKEVIILANRLSTLERKNSEGIITNEEQSVELNKINGEILKLLENETSIEYPLKSKYYQSKSNARINTTNFNPIIIWGSLLGITFLVVYILFSSIFNNQFNTSHKEKEPIVQFNKDNTNCITEVLTQEHSIFWDCINKQIKNRDYQLALKYLEESKDKTNDFKKLKDINSKINYIEIILQLSLDDAIGYFSEDLIISKKNGKKG